jgi:hypothetical protein
VLKRYRRVALLAPPVAVERWLVKMYTRLPPPVGRVDSTPHPAVHSPGGFGWFGLKIEQGFEPSWEASTSLEIDCLQHGGVIGGDLFQTHQTEIDLLPRISS